MAKEFQPTFTTKDGFFCICYVAFCRVITFGTGTVISEVVYYRKKDLTTSTSIGVTAVHLIMYKLGVALLSVISLIWYMKELLTKRPAAIVLILSGMLGTLLIVGLLLLLATNSHLHAWVIKLLYKLIKKPAWRESIDGLNEQVYSLKNAIQKISKDKKAFGSLILINVSKLILWYSIPYIILSQNHSTSYFTTFAMVSFATVLAGILPSPAGIGSFEFVYMLLFRSVFGTVDSFASLLLYRFATYLLPFFIGLVYAGVMKKRKLNEEFFSLKKR